MTEALTGALVEVAIAVVSFVVAGITAYLGTAAKKLADSKQVREYSEALKAFDEDIYRAAIEIGAAMESRVRSEAEGFTESDRYRGIRESLLRYAEEVGEKTGVRTDLSEEHIDTLVQTAIREGREAWRMSYGQ